MNSQNNVSRRWLILIVGVFTMLFSGILYAWSILKVPFAEVLHFDPAYLNWSYTFTMCFFCIGGLVSSKLLKIIGTRFTIMLSGILAGGGFLLSGFLVEGGALLLFLTYAFMAGLGIGMAYIVIISTVNSWFPDKRGLSSGALMMGFGLSTLILGKVCDTLFATSFGWRNTYILIGIIIGAVIILSSFIIKAPSESVILPEKKNSAKRTDDFVAQDLTTGQMIRRFTFWRAFVAFVCITAVGSSVISFARDLTISVGADTALAATLVGVLAVCNGLGRIITGAVFDTMGRRFTMIGANILTIIAAALTLVSVSINSLPLCIVGLCLSGLSYGTSPTMASAFTSAFYGQKHFASNLSATNFNLMGASLIASVCGNLQASSGGYNLPFILLLVLASVALVLNISIKKP